MEAMGLRDIFYGGGLENESKTSLTRKFETKLKTIDDVEISKAVEAMPKLRTYKCPKQNSGTEFYVKAIENRKRHSIIAKLRLGILPINIETGRYKREEISKRTCPNCPTDVEDETHFITKCPAYNKERKILYTEFEKRNNLSLERMNNSEQLFLLLNINNIINQTGIYIEQSMEKRKDLMKRIP